MLIRNLLRSIASLLHYIPIPAENIQEKYKEKNIIDLTIDEIPVVFIHSGSSWYLKEAISQATTFNKNVILIGNKTPENIGCTVLSLKQYYKSAAEFKKIYKHYSVNPYNSELICFLRWFVIKDFMAYHKIDYIFSCDSDVLLYANITEEAKKIPLSDACYVLLYDQDKTIKSATSGVSFWSFKGLNNFCNMVMKIYSTSEGQEYLARTWEEMKHGIKGNISDMFFFKLFANRHSVSNITDIRDNSTFELCLHLDEGRYKMVPTRNEKVTLFLETTSNFFRSHGLLSFDFIWNFIFQPYRIKKLTWINKIPYATIKETDSLVRLCCLHFQGRSKKYIKRARKGLPLPSHNTMVS